MAPPPKRSSRKKKNTLLRKLGTWWMRTPIGGLLHMGLVKLSPIQRQLQAFEVANVMAYYNNWGKPKRWPLFRFYAWLWTYMVSGFRLLALNASARQDYYALNRQSAYTSHVVPLISDLLKQTGQLIKPRLTFSNATSEEVAISLDESCTSQSDGGGGTQPEKLPILVVPGLNTPPAFFREMAEYFEQQGYPIYIAEMPENGLSSVKDAADALNEQIEALRHHYNVDRINIVGHCLGGLVAKYLIDNVWKASRKAPIKTLVTLGTGFLGAAGVQRLKDYWVPRNPDKPIPVVFDQLIKAQQAWVNRSADIAYHSIMAVWDFIVPLQNGFLRPRSGTTNPGIREAHSKKKPSLYNPCDNVHNHVVDDWQVDHLTLALNPKALKKIQECLESPA
jgi:pimeloyl-ACP methyl ester carboxylesterase